MDSLASPACTIHDLALLSATSVADPMLKQGGCGPSYTHPDFAIDTGTMLTISETSQRTHPARAPHTQSGWAPASGLVATSTSASMPLSLTAALLVPSPSPEPELLVPVTEPVAAAARAPPPTSAEGHVLLSQRQGGGAGGDRWSRPDDGDEMDLDLLAAAVPTLDECMVATAAVGANAFTSHNGVTDCAARFVRGHSRSTSNTSTNSTDSVSDYVAMVDEEMHPLSNLCSALYPSCCFRRLRCLFPMLFPTLLPMASSRWNLKRCN
jgi:hypothetical protein